MSALMGMTSGAGARGGSDLGPEGRVRCTCCSARWHARLLVVVAGVAASLAWQWRLQSGAGH
jgi:hypothetical protein